MSTSEEEELEVLALLVETYEDKRYPINIPTPIDAIRFFMDQNSLSNSDMIPYLGSASKVSEVLSGKRNLSKSMIKNLVQNLGIPAEILLEVPPTAAESKYTLSFFDTTLSLNYFNEEGSTWRKTNKHPSSYNPTTDHSFQLAV